MEDKEDRKLPAMVVPAPTPRLATIPHYGQETDAPSMGTIGMSVLLDLQFVGQKWKTIWDATPMLNQQQWDLEYQQQ